LKKKKKKAIAVCCLRSGARCAVSGTTEI